MTLAVENLDAGYGAVRILRGLSLAVDAGGIRHRIAFSGDALTVPALLTAINQQVEVRDLSLREPAIEDLVRQISARNRRGGTA